MSNDHIPYDKKAVDEIIEKYENIEVAGTDSSKEHKEIHSSDGAEKNGGKKKRTIKKHSTKGNDEHKTVGKNAKSGNKALRTLKSIITNKKLQLTVAIALTLLVVVGYPTYSWFKYQRQIERFEKISTPNSLYITAARREDSKYIEVGGVDVMAYWKDSSGNSLGRVTYQDYVFSVAGDYTTSYTLQLAHTTNNNYTYTIYEADVTNVDPSLSGRIIGRDYVEYKITNDFDPEILSEISAKPAYSGLSVGDKLYYYPKVEDDGVTKISLNATNPTEGNANNVVPTEYTIGGETVKYNGHYLNWSTDFTALSTGTLHDSTYGSTKTVGVGQDVNTHAEPLYWQVTRNNERGAVERSAFYHEYILRISWTTDDSKKATSDYKDTDLIYLTVKADD